MSAFLERIKPRIPQAIRWLDYPSAFFLLGFCFFSFAYLDTTIGGYHSLGIAKGHILDWYDYNNHPYNDYLPSTYWLMGIWEYIPYKFFGWDPYSPIVTPGILWEKAETLLFAVFTAFVIKKIIEELGYGKTAARTAAYFWFATPLMIFSLLIFSQLDIYTMFFMMLGILYLLRKNLLLFTVNFGIAMTFKYFAVLAFIPLLLLAEKDVLRIVRYLVIFILPAAFEVFLYKDSLMFRQVFIIGQSRNNAVFALMLGDLLHIFPFVWALITALAYWLDVKEDKEEFGFWVFYIPLLIFTALFMSISWYPQWLMMLTPFAALVTLYQKRLEFFLLLELVTYYFFISYCVHYFPNEVDARMFIYGGFGAYGLVDLGRVMKTLFPLFAERTWNYTAFSAGLASFVLFTFPYAYFLPGGKMDYRLKAEDCGADHLRVRLFYSVALFSVPAIWCLTRPHPLIPLVILLSFPLAQFSLILYQRHGRSLGLQALKRLAVE